MQRSREPVVKSQNNHRDFCLRARDYQIVILRWVVPLASLLLLLSPLAARSSARAFAAVVPARTIPDISKYEGRIIASVEVVIEEAALESAAVAEFRALLRVAPETRFSAVQVRESLQALFDSERVAKARVEAFDVAGQGENGRARVGLRFHISPQVLLSDVVFDFNGGAAGAPVSEDEMRARLNLLEPGKRVSEQSLGNSADSIQAYLRDRGYYRANIEYEQRLDATKTRATVIYRVTLGARTTVEAFNINIDGFDRSAVAPDLQIRPGAPFTLAALSEDIERIRQAIIAEGRLAPRIDAPQVQLNQERNTITVTLAGAVGPKVAVAFGNFDPGEKKARELLPVKREGTIDQSAITEGARRLRNHLQEQGYFFPDVTAVCSVIPPLANNNASAALPPAATATAGGQAGAVDTTCDNLNPDVLSDRTITITYDVERGRRFKLTDIRIEGTEKLTVEDVEDNLSTKKANALGFIPVLGYGRGYTSNDALEKDRRTIEARMRDLGYRRAVAQVRQGVSLEGENLIITFVVNEGPLTRVVAVETRGNQIFTADTLLDATCPAIRAPDEFCTIIDGPFSRSQARADADRLRSFYSRNGYLDAEVDVDIVDLPATSSGDEQVRIIYTIKEADKIFINRIFINGLARTEREAVMTAIPLREGEVLRAADLAETERILYATDAFRQVIVRPESAGENASGYKRRDIIIDVEERQSYDMQYGGGYSTDNGPLGLFEIRNNNLFGKLRQGALRSRASRRQQLLRFEYFDPRFRSYNKFDFAPLAISVQYQRDTSVTRFFRSTIDRGNFGIVQRLDEEGKPIDLDCVSGSSSFPNCERASDPSINRFTVNVETQRDFELELGPRGEVRKRSTLFLRYNYEDVRLFNINSLIIRDVLQPDRVVRLSRFAATFARDTRDRQLDATRGEFFTADYALALKNLGGNLSFSKLQTTYRRYYKINRVRETVLAGAVQFGLAKIYGARDRDDNGVIDNFDRTLPISERFFSGGSTSLRGFGFEEAGPRLAILPRGRFFDTQGKEVTLNPFLVPVGGNALAVVNLEARVTVRKNVQAVPFYDGGNVFRRASDIFRRAAREDEDPNLRARWTHTVGLGARIKTPFGPLAVDYGFLLNPPEFVLPQSSGDPAIIRLKRGQFHFRFGQTF